MGLVYTKFRIRDLLDLRGGDLLLSPFPKKIEGFRLPDLNMVNIKNKLGMIVSVPFKNLSNSKLADLNPKDLIIKAGPHNGELVTLGVLNNQFPLDTIILFNSKIDIVYLSSADIPPFSIERKITGIETEVGYPQEFDFPLANIS